MRMKRVIMTAVLCLIAATAGYIAGRRETNRPYSSGGQVIEIRADTVREADTVRAEKPKPVKIEIAWDRGRLGDRTNTTNGTNSRAAGPGGSGEIATIAKIAMVGERGERSGGSELSELSKGSESEAAGMRRRDEEGAGIVMERKTYTDSATYRAVISGAWAELDTIEVWPRREIITREITKEVWREPKRWSVGMGVGYGWNGRSFGPWAGVSVSYKLWEF